MIDQPCSRIFFLVRYYYFAHLLYLFFFVSSAVLTPFSFLTFFISSSYSLDYCFSLLYVHLLICMLRRLYKLYLFLHSFENHNKLLVRFHLFSIHMFMNIFRLTGLIYYLSLCLMDIFYFNLNLNNKLSIHMNINWGKVDVLDGM